MRRILAQYVKRRGRGLWAGLLALQSESGSALVEVAFLMAALSVPMILVTIDAGSMTMYSIEVSNAVHTGAMAGMAPAPSDANLTATKATIITATQADATDFGTNLTVTPVYYYACSAATDGTQYTGSLANALAAATAACPASNPANHYLEFVQVNDSAV